MSQSKSNLLKDHITRMLQLFDNNKSMSSNMITNQSFLSFQGRMGMD